MVKLKEKFSFSGLWVSSHEPISDFYASSWQRGRSAVPMLVVRLVLALVATGILTWSLYESPTRYWPIYLTNWGLLMVVMLTLSGLLVSIMTACRRLDEDSGLPWYVSLYWFMFNVTVGVAFMITALYWILLYNPEADPETYTNRMFLLDIATHGMNSVLVICELFAARTPVRLLHFYQPLGVGLWYAGFSAVYFLAGGTDANENPFIYEVLDWRQAAQAGGIVAGSAGGILLIYLAIWGLSIFRDWASSALIRTKSHDLPYTPSDNDLQIRIV